MSWDDPLHRPLPYWRRTPVPSRRFPILLVVAAIVAVLVLAYVVLRAGPSRRVHQPTRATSS